MHMFFQVSGLFLLYKFQFSELFFWLFPIACSFHDKHFRVTDKAVSNRCGSKGGTVYVLQSNLMQKSLYTFEFAVSLQSGKNSGKGLRLTFLKRSAGCVPAVS